MNHKYSFTLAWSEEDGDYICLCPEFVGLSAFGTTPEIALGKAQVALALMIESHEEDGDPLPAPQYFDMGAHFAERKARRAGTDSKDNDSTPETAVSSS